MCPCCSGPLMFLGLLGKCYWLRCRNCGVDVRVDEDDAE